MLSAKRNSPISTRERIFSYLGRYACEPAIVSQHMHTLSIPPSLTHTLHESVRMMQRGIRVIQSLSSNASPFQHKTWMLKSLKEA